MKYHNMHNLEKFFHNKYSQFNISPPSLHFVLGSCMSSALNEVRSNNYFSAWDHKGHILFSEVPDLPSPSAPSHLGRYDYFVHKKTGSSICFQSGRLHGYEGLSPSVVARSVIGPKLAGTDNFILSNISGGLTKQTSVGCIVAIQDHINLTGKSPLQGPQFIDMTNAYHQQLTLSLTSYIKKQRLDLRFGVYAIMSGPQLETPAEIRMLIAAGADVVGMSTVWEVISLHHLGAKISCISVVSNMAAGIGKSVEIDSIKLQPIFIKLIKSFVLFSEEKLQ